MANNQPLNTTIAVFNRVRVARQDLRHESLRALTGNGMRGLIVSVPGEEKLVGVTRDSNTYSTATSLIHGRGTGLPLVRIPEADLTVSAFYSGDTTLDFPVRLPGCRDFQIQKKSANVADDLHAAARSDKSGPNL